MDNNLIDSVIKLQAEVKKLRKFFNDVATLTIEHEGFYAADGDGVIDTDNLVAAVACDKLGRVLHKVDPEWWKDKDSPVRPRVLNKRQIVKEVIK